MKTSYTAVLCAILFIAAFPNPVCARPEVDLSAGVNYAGGVTQYEIGGIVKMPAGSAEVPFPISRLEFPMDFAFLNLEARLKIKEKWRVAGEFQKSFTNPGSDMKDSDWLFSGFGSKETKDIYSAGETDCDMWTADVWASYTFLEAVHGQGSLTGPDPSVKYHVFAGLGFLHQNFSYDVHDLDQFYPRRPDIPHDIVAGTYLKYDLALDAPYVLVGADGVFGKSWKLELQGKASWFTHAQDKDQHLLRDLTAKVDSDWDGYTYIGSFEARYNINEHWFCKASGELIHVNVDAESYTTQPGVKPYTIHQEINSNQSHFGVSVGYGF